MLVTLKPVVQGNYTSWSLGAGASKPAAMAVDDDDTTYIAYTGGAARDTYRVDQIPAYAVSINQVDVEGRLRIVSNAATPANESVFVTIRLGSTDSNPASLSTTGAGPTAWTTVTASAVARPGGGSWGLGDFPGSSGGAEIGAYGPVSHSGSVLRASYVAYHPDIVPSVGGYVSIVASVLGAVLGSQLGLCEVQTLLRQINRKARGRILIHGYEAAQLYRALKEHRYPVHFDLASQGGV